MRRRQVAFGALAVHPLVAISLCAFQDLHGIPLCCATDHRPGGMVFSLSSCGLLACLVSGGALLLARQACRDALFVLWTDGYFAPKFLKGKTKMRLCKKYLRPSTGAYCRPINKRC